MSAITLTHTITADTLNMTGTDETGERLIDLFCEEIEAACEKMGWECVIRDTAGSRSESGAGPQTAIEGADLSDAKDLVNAAWDRALARA